MKKTDHQFIASYMTGCFSAIGKYARSIPNDERKRILEILIKVWSEYSELNEVHQKWIKEWEDAIEEIERKELKEAV